MFRAGPLANSANRGCGAMHGAGQTRRLLHDGPSLG